MPSPIFVDNAADFAEQYAIIYGEFGPGLPGAYLPSLEDSQHGAFAAKVRFYEATWLLAADVVAEIIAANDPPAVAEVLAGLQS